MAKLFVSRALHKLAKTSFLPIKIDEQKNLSDKVSAFAAGLPEVGSICIVRNQQPVVVVIVYWGLKNGETTQLKDFDSKQPLEIKSPY